jgi:L-lactate dehydrogenase complex protein LldG
MSEKAREEILGRLKAAKRNPPPERPHLPPLSELSWDRERLLKEFVDNLQAQTVVSYRVNDNSEAAEKLAEIVSVEAIKKVAISADSVIEQFNLPEWGKRHQVEILRATDFLVRSDFKRMIFDEAQAGITGVDFAIAESGTLCLIHDKNQPRLVSLAPIMHIALLPLERLFPTYESAVDAIFSKGKDLPSQVTFITGPSMTADIQGVPFKGMHGPKKLAVIIVG